MWLGAVTTEGVRHYPACLRMLNVCTYPLRDFQLAYLAKVEQAITAQSTIHLDGSYVVPIMVDIDGFLLRSRKLDLLVRHTANMNCYILAT
jgi:hypothetical protein